MGVINRRELSGTGVSPAHVEKFLDLLDQALDEFVNVSMDDAADVGSGGTTRLVGFQLRNVKGDKLALSIVLEFAAFDEAGLVTPAVNATLDDVGTVGTILSGDGTAALKVRTDAKGKFTCTLTDLTDEQISLGSSPSFGSSLLDCREIDQVTFSA